MSDIQKLLDFFQKIQYNLGASTVQNTKLLDYNFFDYSPDMAMFSLNYIVKKSFTRNSVTPRSFDDGICFYFKNVTPVENYKEDETVFSQSPSLHIFPYSAERVSNFKKNEKVQVLCIIVRTGFLKQLLGKDAEEFAFLFDNYRHFFIEEILTNDIVKSVSDILALDEANTLTDFHYRLLGLQLLFYLFKSLRNRKRHPSQKLNNKDIAAIYKAKDALLADLTHAITVNELSIMTGMSVSKMRKLFIQIFGMGIYDYFQKHRMIEAVRRLKEDQCSVTEVGYGLGFENLSHFTRVFEKYIGMKPKMFSKLN